MDFKNERKKTLYLVLFFLGLLLISCIIILLVFHPNMLTSAFDTALAMLQPFLYGAVIAYLLNPAVSHMEHLLLKVEKRWCRKEHPGLLRMFSILLSFLLIILIILLLVGMILPEIITSISGIIKQLPGVIQDFQNWISTLDQSDLSHELITYINQITETLSSRLQNFLATDLLPSMQAVISNVTSSFLDLINILKNFGIGCIVATYLLGGKEKFLAQGKLVLYSVFSRKWAERILRELRYADKMFSGFLIGKLIDSLIIGILCFLFCFLVNMPYAMLVSLIVGITNMIPFFGPYLGAIPSAFLILIVSPSKCLLFVVFIIILQQIDGNILGPFILGDKVGLSGFWVLFSILVFGSLWGLLGMLIGVPVFAVIYHLLQKLIGLALTARKQTRLLENYRQQFPPKS
ncbi:MAG: AI-2E family transporter [Lachnospiraceae bacterium]|nr:AI-2E family transporter [Lachnospiraceae bacterium]